MTHVPTLRCEGKMDNDDPDLEFDIVPVGDLFWSPPR